MSKAEGLDLAEQSGPRRWAVVFNLLEVTAEGRFVCDRNDWRRVPCGDLEHARGLLAFVEASNELAAKSGMYPAFGWPHLDDGMPVYEVE